MKIHWTRTILAFVYAFVETSYFGWNRWPKSDAEVLAEGIAFVLIAMCFEG